MYRVGSAKEGGGGLRVLGRIVRDGLSPAPILIALLTESMQTSVEGFHRIVRR